ncbi:FAD-dependent oxidoreductase [Taklimakanibacter deserti]|uniref:FAD-dependent oxidoreductase n=1 Tax=Taklimakanibacter deserti TaxID=2267839 RepID=UPI0034D67FBB
MRINAAAEASRSLWMEVAPFRATPLEKSNTTEVAIIGSGICGTSLAYELTSKGVAVVMLDRGQIARGMSSRTSAHLTFQSDDLYQEVIARRGERIAKLHYQSQRAAVDRIETIVKSEGIACDYKRLDGILGLARGQKVELLKDEIEACHRLGYSEVRWATKEELARLKTTSGLCFPQQARFHPIKYLNALLKRIEARGGHIHAHSPVIRLEETRTGVTLTTASGQTVRAKTAVVATNSPIEPKVAIHTKQMPYRSYVLGAEIPKKKIADALYWDTEDPYHYVRLQPGSRRDMLIVGGEDHRTGEADNAEVRFRKLETWMRRRFPEAGAVKYRWSGQILDPIDYTAFIGRSPGRKRTFLATGDSGQGLTHGVVAGLLLADFIRGKSSPWQGVYRPQRKTIDALGRYVSDNLAVAENMLGYLTPGQISVAERLKPGNGAILRHGLEKLAVCRDRKGRLHVHSASCTHVGCLIKWNSFEQCWDCPCHGSHFAPDGEALNAPAVNALATAKLPRRSAEPASRRRSASARHGAVAQDPTQSQRG